MDEQHPPHPAEWLKDGKTVAIIFTLAVQLVSGAWWAASIASTVSMLDHRLTTVEQTTSGPTSVLTQISSRTARIEGQLDGISEQLRTLNGESQRPRNSRGLP